MFDPSDQLLTIEQSKSVLPFSKQWFAKQRMLGGGPAYVKIGNRVFYRRSSLEAYAEGHAVRPSATQEAA